MADGAAAAIIDRLGLTPHPEGGWFRETWRAEAAPGERPSATAIHFLLEPHQRSHWHRIDAAEIWLWHAGAPLTLSVAADDQGPARRIALGPDVLAGEEPQALVPPGHWQAARPVGGWTLVSCLVSPGFDFAHFELASEGWAPGN
ncbi:MAG: cupin domain-containing protein [Sphingomonadales bacterium]|nr:cupin domain-containing protein [Sphingomonadales bacterium]